MTYGSFVDDIMVALGMTHDDALWYRDNILQNTLYCESKLLTQSLSADLGPASDSRAASDKLSVVIVPVTYNANPTDALWAYLYFDLPSQVYDLPFDGGVNFIRYHRLSLPVSCKPSIAGATFTQTTLGALSGVYGSTYQRPSEEQPYYARSKSGNLDRVYLFGMSPLISQVMVGLFAAPNFLTVDYESDMPIEAHRLYALKNMVLEMSVWPLGIPQERLKNDGRDMEPNQVVNTRPAISVNNPAVLEQ